MEEGFAFEVKGVVDEVFGCLQFVLVGGEDVSEYVLSPDVFDVGPNRGEQLLDFRVTDESMPVEIVFVYVFFEVFAGRASVVSPWVAAEDFVSSRASEDYFDEFSGKFGGVVVRVGLPDSWFFQVVGEVGQAAFHVAGFEDDLVMFGFEAGRHGFGFFSFVECQFDA